jgi:hypothetical protein
MRSFSCLTLAAGLLAIAAPVSAATIVENFTISVSGDADTNYLSTPFDLFDPSFGTLTGVAESVTGSLTWNFGDDTGETLLLALAKTGASQFSLSSGPGGSQVIAVSLNGAGGFQDPAFLGPGTTQESLTASGPGTLSGDDLLGQVTYTYTPAAAPEASTWAMMLVGFAGLGYAVVRRKGAYRSVPA